MKQPQVGPYTAGKDSGPINVALQRPTVNVKEAENQGEEAAAAGRVNLPPVRLSKHATFGPPKMTHPGLE
jgi:hypothetical protein